VLDGIDLDPDEATGLTFEPVPRSCVRGQLPVAVGSPITAIEDEYNRSARQEFGQMPGPPLLIGQREVGRLIHAIPSSGDFGGLDQPHDATDSDPPVEPDAEETDEDGTSKPG